MITITGACEMRYRQKIFPDHVIVAILFVFHSKMPKPVQFISDILNRNVGQNRLKQSYSLVLVICPRVLLLNTRGKCTELIHLRAI